MDLIVASFSVQVIDAPEKLQLGLIELQYNSIMLISFNQEALITYASLPISQFSELH
jgi:hypothetical protein